MKITLKTTMSLPTAGVTLALCAAGMGLALSAQAAAPLQAATLPADVVACNSLKNAQDYTQYTRIAPKFAKDMRDRANCFQTKEAMEAVNLGSVNGYTHLKLLTGHVVWLPSGKVQVR